MPYIQVCTAYYCIRCSVPCHTYWAVLLDRKAELRVLLEVVCPAPRARLGAAALEHLGPLNERPIVLRTSTHRIGSPLHAEACTSGCGSYPRTPKHLGRMARAGIASPLRHGEDEAKQNPRGRVGKRTQQRAHFLGPARGIQKSNSVACSNNQRCLISHEVMKESSR